MRLSLVRVNQAQAATLASMTPSAQKVVEGVQDFASLDGIRTDISSILVTASNDINKLGLPVLYKV